MEENDKPQTGGPLSAPPAPLQEPEMPETPEPTTEPDPTPGNLPEPPAQR